MAENAEKSYWVLIPSSLYQYDLDSRDRELFGIILGGSAGKGYCWMSNAYLAERVNASEGSVKRSLVKLADQGAIRINTIKSGLKWSREIYPALAKDQYDPSKDQDDPLEGSYCASSKDHIDPVIVNNNNNKEESESTHPLEVHFSPLTEQVTTDNRFILLGRKPLKKYPQLWMSATELDEVLEKYAELTPDARADCFRRAERKYQEAVKLRKQPQDRISAVDWLLTYIFTDKLDELKKLNWHKQSTGETSKRPKPKDFIPAWEKGAA